MTAKIDLKANSRIQLDKNGYRVERVALVSGVVGNIDALLKNAIEDAQLPNYGDAYPTIAEITLNNIVCTPLGGGKYKITMSYYKDTAIATGSASAKVTISASTATEEITKDLTGAAFATKYNGTPDNGSGGIMTGNVWSNVTVDRPRLNIDFEYTSASVPTADISTYLGAINSVIWNGYAAKTILCTAIDVTEQGSGYKIRYSFSYNADEWGFVGQVLGAELPLLAHPVTPDAGLDLTTGQRPFDVFPTADFTPLGFTI